VSPRRANAQEIEVRSSRAGDEGLAEAAAELIREAAKDWDVAVRPVDVLREKLGRGQAAVALLRGRLVGFGYWSSWESGKFVSHSGLVVRRDLQGLGLGRRMKLALFEGSRAALPRATLMSLTTHPKIKELNASLGFVPVPLERLTNDPAFWEGCKGCRNYEDVRSRGERCCCEAMILEPPAQPADSRKPGAS
jgi:GNAT superfamily N-acetyltransferase